MSTDASSESRHEDPMSADKRVLVIGLVVMVALVSVGVVSASLFASSACDDLEPSAVDGRMASTELEPVLEAVGEGERVTELAAFADALADTFGPVTGAAEVTGATGLAPLDGGLVAFGPTTTTLEASGAAVMAVAGFEEPAELVGSGERLYSLALTNELTGQVDALQPHDAELQPGTCVDTAVVGDPFAFYLDAGGGQLLLVRIEEDGDTPELELRDAVQGRLWFADLEVPVAPPGILAERITGALGQDVVVAARRTVPGDEQPAVIAVDRDAAERRWELPTEVLLDAVGPALGGDGAVWLDVRDVDGGRVVIAAASEQDRDAAALIVLDLADGTIQSVVIPEDGPTAIEDVALHDGEVWVAWRDDADADGITVESYGPDGASLVRERHPGDEAVLADGLVATSAAVLRTDGGEVVEVAAVPDGVRVSGLMREGDVTSVLLEVGAGAAVVLTFAGGA